MGNKGGESLVSAVENKSPVLRIFDLFVRSENPETAGG
jgi:hypothetical protein